MVHLKYRSNGRIGDIFFPDEFYVEAYIDTNVDKPDYPIIEEAEEDQAGDRHILFQKWDKRSMFNFYGVEYMADAISLLPLMDEVFVNGKRVYDVTVDNSWSDEYDCLVSITVSYSEKKAIKTL